jgi:uncharacterized membrane protein YhaH (DUF805 family)
MSLTIAAIAGPTMLAIGASEALTYDIWASNIAPLIYLNGVLLFLVGLTIVRAHNRWTPGWPMLVTLTGWIGILGGLFRMFAPEVQQAGENAPTTIGTAVLVAVVGAVLAFEAYRPRTGP